MFFKACFSISFSLQTEDDFDKQKNKNNETKVAKLLTYGGQVIDPTAYIYIYTHTQR